MRIFGKFCLAILLLLGAGWLARGQEVIDAIAARIENDIILLSDIRELSRYQLFLDGQSEDNAKILDHLIDQWIVRNEANAALFPQPSDEEVDRNLARIKRSFGSAEEFEAHQKQSGLSNEDLRRLVKSQLYLSNYLDSRFRASIRIDDKAIEEFYKERVIPRAEARGRKPPTLDAAHDFIQEALVQRAVNEQADRWLKESRSRVKVQNLLREGAR